MVFSLGTDANLLLLHRGQRDHRNTKIKVNKNISKQAIANRTQQLKMMNYRLMPHITDLPRQYFATFVKIRNVPGRITSIEDAKTSLDPHILIPSLSIFYESYILTDQLKINMHLRKINML